MGCWELLFSASVIVAKEHRIVGLPILMSSRYFESLDKIKGVYGSIYFILSLFSPLSVR